MQSQQMQNMADNVVSVLENQQSILQNMSHSLRQGLNQQAPQVNPEEQSAGCHSDTAAANEQPIQVKTATVTVEAASVVTEAAGAKMTTTEAAKKTTTEAAATAITPSIIQDCSDLLSQEDYSSGIYTITPNQGSSFDVYCEMEVDGGGWTVFQKRYDGSMDFYRGWTEYVEGFGSLVGEFWLGLEKMYQLSQSGATWVLRINLEAFDGDQAYAEYQSFSIGDVVSNYKLYFGSYNGTAGNSLQISGWPFTTYDMNNNNYGNDNCAQDRQGAWWYWSCRYGNSNLNGRYQEHGLIGMFWGTWKSSWQFLKASTMMLKRIQ
ncbi:fibrinogen-like protein A [Amphiura filiformis]|uniref:fibrinogen-like protein A n=1 Tax=Amphiura filiformis TaxID=82378 RepID=UPI003B221812